MKKFAPKLENAIVEYVAAAGVNLNQVKACPHMRILVPFLPGMSFHTADALVSQLPNFDLKSREPVKKFIYHLQQQNAIVSDDTTTAFAWDEATAVGTDYMTVLSVPRVFNNIAPFLRFPQSSNIFEKMRVNPDPLIGELLKRFFAQHEEKLEDYWAGEKKVLGRDGQSWGKTAEGTAFDQRATKFIRQLLARDEEEGGNFVQNQALLSVAQLLTCDESNSVTFKTIEGNNQRRELEDYEDRLIAGKKKAIDEKVGMITEVIEQYRQQVEPMIKSGNGYDDRGKRNTNTTWNMMRDDPFSATLIGTVVSGWLEWQTEKSSAGDQSGDAAGKSEGYVVLSPSEGRGIMGRHKHIILEGGKCRGREYESYKDICQSLGAMDYHHKKSARAKLFIYGERDIQDSDRGKAVK
jgi:hypothetical protein